MFKFHPAAVPSINDAVNRNPNARVPSGNIAVFVCSIIGGLEEGALTLNNPEIGFFCDHHRCPRYIGPRPLPGHGAHRYRFHQYAVATRIDPSSSSSEQELLASVDGHLLASGRITGTRTS